MPYPASLLEKLSKDTDNLDLELSREVEASASIPAAKDLARRRLLAATPRAIQTLETLMESGEEKVKLGAASKILDKSPATETEMGSAGSGSIPAEAMASLISSLSTFAQAAIQSAAAYAGANPQGSPFQQGGSDADPYANIRAALEPETKIKKRKKSSSNIPVVRIALPKEKQ